MPLFFRLNPPGDCSLRPTTTGIGSLPFSDMDEALNYVFQHYTLGFLPQIARGDGDGGMLALVLPPKLAKRGQSGFGVALIDLLEDPAIREAFLDLESLEGTRAVQDAQEVASLLQAHGHVKNFKAQMMGPLSLLQTLRDAASRPLWSDNSLHEPVLNWSIALARTMASALAPHCDELHLWLDEPMLGLMEGDNQRDAAYALLNQWHEAVSAMGIKTGIHCCSSPPFGLLKHTPFATFSCDAVRYRAEIEDATDLLHPYIKNGGQLALGLLAPMNWSEDVDQRPFVLELAKSLGIDSPQELEQKLLLTPSCGTMLTPVDRELEIAQTLEQWATSVAENWK
ncbi:MAG: hypothetical protein ACI97A_000865 [Planctomycetota bacterium]|jgi:hypothetical protein